MSSESSWTSLDSASKLPRGKTETAKDGLTAAKLQALPQPPASKTPFLGGAAMMYPPQDAKKITDSPTNHPQDAKKVTAISTPQPQDVKKDTDNPTRYPAHLDWKTRPAEFARYMIREEKRERILDATYPGWRDEKYEFENPAAKEKAKKTYVKPRTYIQIEIKKAIIRKLNKPYGKNNGLMAAELLLSIRGFSRLEKVVTPETCNLSIVEALLSECCEEQTVVYSIRGGDIVYFAA